MGATLIISTVSITMKKPADQDPQCLYTRSHMMSEIDITAVTRQTGSQKIYGP